MIWEDILLWCGDTMMFVNRDELTRWIARKSLENDRQKTEEKEHNNRGEYEDAFDWFLKNLKKAITIQVYQDGIVRIHLEIMDRKRRRAAFLENSKMRNSEKNKALAEALFEFAEQEE